MSVGSKSSARFGLPHEVRLVRLPLFDVGVTVTLIDDLLTRTQRHAADFLNSLDRQPVCATATLGELRHRLGVALNDEGMSPTEVVDDLVAATAGGHLGSAGGRFFAWVIGGAVPSALAADWLVSTWDNNAALYACGPASAVVEEVAGDWVKDILNLPAAASFAFTTGCQMAHVTCLAAARHALLRDRGWDVETLGLCGAPRIRVLATEHRHGSVTRALRFLGLGSSSLEPLATDSDSTVPPGVLQTALRASDVPTIVVLDAADLNVGAIDPFAELIPLAKTAGAWVHVDGAFGLWARASVRQRHLVAGIESANSWATDAHKWLNTPKDIGIALVSDVAAHKAAMCINAAYLSTDGDARDQIDWTPDWTRRARGFPVYAALRELGRHGVASLIDRCCDHADALVMGLTALPSVELVARPTLNQGLVRFLSCRPDATEADHDARTNHVIDAINREGTAFFSGTTWRGRRAMRISVVNWRTTAADDVRTIAAVASVLETNCE
jgi:glutamate/tyrosine decarboxylase-like PLP-dependent enzyme